MVRMITNIELLLEVISYLFLVLTICMDRIGMRSVEDVNPV